MKKKIVINTATIIAILALVFGQFIRIFVWDMFQIPINQQTNFIAQAILIVYTGLLMAYIILFFSIEVKNNKLRTSLKRTKENFFFILGTDMFILANAFILHIFNFADSSVYYSPDLWGIFCLVYIVVMVGSFGLGFARRYN